MSTRRSGPGGRTLGMPKVSLAMLKGKPSNLSVPSIRFNPGEEDLEEVLEENLLDDEEEPAGTEMVSMAVDATASGSSDMSLGKRSVLSSSHSADATKESSPVKENLQKIGKRSASLDSGASTVEANSDTWSLFHEIKGKITKKVEEKLHIDLRSNGTTVTTTATKPSVEQIPSDDIVDTGTDDASNDCQKGSDSPEAEVAREALEGETPDADSSSSSLDLKSELAADSGSAVPSLQPSQPPVERAASHEIRNRRARLRHKSDGPSISMSFLATQSLDEEALEEELHSEYDRLNLQEQNEKDNARLPDFVPPSIDSSIAPKKVPRLTSGAETRLASRRQYWSPTPWQKQAMMYGALGLFLAFAPIPTYLSGVLLGIVSTLIFVNLYYQFVSPPVPGRESSTSAYAAVKQSQVPVIHLKSEVHKGWMNELRLVYSPETYHIGNTLSVFVRLEGSTLRISHPRGKIPKHASWNESHHEQNFCYQRYYNLSGCRVLLLPEGLTKKRLWSRKYPICIMLTETAKTGHLYTSKAATPSGTTSGTEDEVLPASVAEAAKQTSSDREDRLYLFARASREKEEWYWWLDASTRRTEERIAATASQSAPSSPRHASVPRTVLDGADVPGIAALPPKVGLASASSSPSLVEVKGQQGGGTTPIPVSTRLTVDDTPMFQSAASLLEFSNYMQRFVPSSPSSSSSPTLGDEERTTRGGLPGTSKVKGDDAVWLNALLGRIMWDFLHDPMWADMVYNRIQKKLSKIKLPYFMEELTITELELGSQLPTIDRIAPPMMDARGLWVDLDMSYGGKFKMTLQTKLNLMKLRKEFGDKEPSSPTDKQTPARTAMFDSDEEDSAESSTDEEAPLEMVENPCDESGPSSSSTTATQPSASKKLLRFMDMVTQSRYFQQATELRYVRRAMEGVSNTRLILSVELHHVSGTLALNIPPPPTDRLWYGFRANPKVTLVARPRLGDREVTVSSVTEWIRKKLIQEFQKLFVMPNMDDVPIPIMSPGLYSTTNSQATPSASGGSTASQ